MLIKYVGPLDEVSVPAARLEVAAGVPVEVADDVAASLLEQADNWVAVEPKAEKGSRA